MGERDIGESRFMKDTIYLILLSMVIILICLLPILFPSESYVNAIREWGLR
jgi:hypothetical protein